MFKSVNETAVNNCCNKNLQILRDRWTILKDRFGSSKPGSRTEPEKSAVFFGEPEPFKFVIIEPEPNL